MSSSTNELNDYLASRLATTSARRKEDNLSDDEDDEAIFAELEAELDDESGPGMAALREHGLESLKRE